MHRNGGASRQTWEEGKSQKKKSREVWKIEKV